MTDERTEADVTGIAREVEESADRWGEAADRLRGAQDEIARSRESLAHGGTGAADQPGEGVSNQQGEDRVGE